MHASRCVIIPHAVASSQSATVPAALLHFIDSGGSPVQFTLDEIERAQTLLALRPFQPLHKFSDNLLDEQLKLSVRRELAKGGAGLRVLCLIVVFVVFPIFVSHAKARAFLQASANVAASSAAAAAAPALR